MGRYASQTSVSPERSRAEIEAVRAFAEQVSIFSWAAGIIEGEGTITITRSGKRYTRPFVSVTSTEPEIIEAIHARWPGQIRTYQPKGNAKLAHAWRLDRRGQIARFLWDILPYLRTERRRRLAWLILQDIGARVQGSRDPRYVEECHERREQVRALNRRGRT